MLRRLFLILVCVLFIASSSTSANTPQLVNYQGQLTKANGDPVDSVISMSFKIYDAPTGGIVIWGETHATVTVVKGAFAVLLGGVNPISNGVFSDTVRYLGITVEGGPVPNPEIAPRSRLVTVPYAFRVSTIDNSSGGAVSGNIDLEASTSTSGNILKQGQRFIHNYGNSNFFAGYNAGNFTLTGTENTSVGNLTLSSSSSGSWNTALGHAALYSSTTGLENTAIGADAMWHNLNGKINTACGVGALSQNTAGDENCAVGAEALVSHTSGNGNTALGRGALFADSTGVLNTAVGYHADVSVGGLRNATAIGAMATVNAWNKIRLGNTDITVIEGQVAYSFTSDRNEKENFQPVDENDVLKKIAALRLTSWNYKNQDPRQYRHYGPTAQDFFAAFGHDGLGQSGDSTTINSGDISGVMLVAIQALEKRTAEVESLKAMITTLQEEVKTLKEVSGKK